MRWFCRKECRALAYALMPRDRRLRLHVCCLRAEAMMFSRICAYARCHRCPCCHDMIRDAWRVPCPPIPTFAFVVARFACFPARDIYFRAAATPLRFFFFLLPPAVALFFFFFFCFLLRCASGAAVVKSCAAEQRHAAQVHARARECPWQRGVMIFTERRKICDVVVCLRQAESAARALSPRALDSFTV